MDAPVQEDLEEAHAEHGTYNRTEGVHGSEKDGDIAAFTSERFETGFKSSNPGLATILTYFFEREKEEAKREAGMGEVPNRHVHFSGYNVLLARSVFPLLRVESLSRSSGPMCTVCSSPGKAPPRTSSL